MYDAKTLRKVIEIIEGQRVKYYEMCRMDKINGGPLLGVALSVYNKIHDVLSDVEKEVLQMTKEMNE